MNETLFSQIQRLFERTYAQVGINLEDCLIDGSRCAQLTKAAGASARELSELARTFIRSANDQLFVGIYYSRWLIEQLERHDPRGGLNNANIRSLIAFVEEINHALHAALQFKQGHREIASEEYARNLELQAQVDTYLVLLLFVAFFRKTQKVSRTDRRWLRFHLFASQNPGAFRCENLRGRYLETAKLASAYTEYLDTLNGIRRLDEIRTFRSLDYGTKKQRILFLELGTESPRVSLCRDQPSVCKSGRSGARERAVDQRANGRASLGGDLLPPVDRHLRGRKRDCEIDRGLFAGEADRPGEAGPGR